MLSGSDKLKPYGCSSVQLDVGKGEHHGCAPDPAGLRVYDRPFPNDEVRAAPLAWPRTDEYCFSPTGALAIAVGRDIGIDVAYLPGMAMRRIADLHPGQNNVETRDGHAIADAARPCRTR